MTWHFSTPRIICTYFGHSAPPGLLDVKSRGGQHKFFGFSQNNSCLENWPAEIGFDEAHYFGVGWKSPGYINHYATVGITKAITFDDLRVPRPRRERVNEKQSEFFPAICR